MPDNSIVIGATVETGAFGEGMNSVADLTRQTASGMAISFEELGAKTKSAFRSIGADVKLAAQSVTADSMRMAEATKAQAAALADLRRANILVRDSNFSASASTAILAAAQDQARAATLALAASQETLGDVTTGGQASLRTMNAEIRSLQGSLYGDTRAASEFLRLLPGVGEAMEVAFPLFGAVALAGVIGMAADQVRNLIGEFKDLSAVANNIDVERILAGDKMQHVKASGGIGHQFARFALGASPDPESIDVKNANAVVRQVEYERQLADAKAAVNEQGLKGVALQKQKIADIQQQIALTKHAKDEAQALVDSYAKQLRASTTVSVGLPVMGMNENEARSVQVSTISDPKERKALTDQATAAVSAVERFGQEAALLQVKLQGAILKLPTIHDKLPKSPHAEHTHHARAEKEDPLLKTQHYNDKADLDAMAQADVKAGEAAQTSARVQVQALRAVYEEQQKTAREKYEDTEKDSAYQVRVGKMTAAQRVQILKQATEQEYMERLRAQKAIEMLDKQDVLRYQQDMFREVEITKQAMRQITQLNQIAGLDLDKSWKMHFATMQQDFTKLVTAMAVETGSMSQQITQMWKQMAAQIIQEVITMTVAYMTGVETQKAGQAMLQLGDAKTAAANTYATISAIPVVGPFLAPPAAALAFAAVMSFEQGGIVSGSHGMAVPIIAHAGERVLTTQQTQNFERMVNSHNTTRSSSVSANVTQHFHGGKASSAKETRQAIQTLMRQGKLAY